MESAMTSGELLAAGAEALTAAAFAMGDWADAQAKLESARQRAVADGALEVAARADSRIAAALDGRDPRRVVAVPGRLVNFVV